MVWDARSSLQNQLLRPILFITLFGLMAFASGGSGSAAAGGALSDSPWISVIVQLEDAPLVNYTGGIQGLKATSPNHMGIAKLDMKSKESQRYLQYLDKKMQAFHEAVASSIPGGKVVYRYRTVLGGVSVVIPENRLNDLAALPGIKKIYPDRSRRKDTDSSPSFIGATKLWGKIGGQEKAGEGIIIGVIDTGVWPEHPSFSDPDPEGKPYLLPPQWTPGAPFCEAPSDGSTPLTCNHKLIGARKFLSTYKAKKGLIAGEFDSPRDSDGHGTHTASTAAGNAGVTASVLGSTIGTISGIAPRAHVAVYKALGIDGGEDSDMVAAIDQAVADGVDVINYSIGPKEALLVDPYLNADDRAFLDAYNAGVFIATSAGNSGPDANTVNHLGGWTTTVAASTESRAFQSSLTLTAGRKKLKLTGSSITNGIPVRTPVVRAAEFGDELCLNPFPPGTFNGEIVVCKRGTNARVAKGFNVEQGGASGMVLYNPTLQGTVPDNHFVPSIHLEFDAGDKLLAFMDENSDVTATLTNGKRSKAPGDVMGSFSSRGGSGQAYGISKPDITGPGVQILAGHTPVPYEVAGGPDGEFFQTIEGTSMSSPHVAGAAALIRQWHPDWTPGQIKSALMTTATMKKLLKEDGVTPSDPFDRGSGRLDLSKAGNPGITFDASGADFLTHKAELWKVNYPSLYIPKMPARMTVQRTARSVLSKTSKWTVTTVSPADLHITAPESITLPAGGDATFDLVLDASSVPKGAVRHATLTLKSGGTVAVLPISIARAP